MIHLLAKTLRLSKCLSDALHLITQSWLNCLEKLSFFGCWKSLSAASKCRKTRPCDHRISKFSGGACPRTPLGLKALRALPILCPGVKLSCPPVENLNEPPAKARFSFLENVNLRFKTSSHGLKRTRNVAKRFELTASVQSFFCKVTYQWRCSEVALGFSSNVTCSKSPSAGMDTRWVLPSSVVQSSLH